MPDAGSRPAAEATEDVEDVERLADDRPLNNPVGILTDGAWSNPSCTIRFVQMYRSEVRSQEVPHHCQRKLIVPFTKI